MGSRQIPGSEQLQTEAECGYNWGTKGRKEAATKERNCYPEEPRLPGAACAYTHIPAAFVSESASSHPSERPTRPPPCSIRSKMQQKRWCRSCRAVHCPPKASSACLAAVLSPKENFVHQKQEQTHCRSVSIFIKILQEWLCLYGKRPF